MLIRVICGECEIHECFYKLVFFQQTVTTVTSSHLIERLHLIRLNARIPDKERNRLGGMRTKLARSRMIGQHSDCYGFVPIFHSFVNRTYGTLIKILDRQEFQVDVSFMSGLIAGFDMQLNKIVSFQSFEGSGYFIFIIRIIKSGSSFYGNTAQTGIVTDSVNQIDC